MEKAVLVPETDNPYIYQTEGVQEVSENNCIVSSTTFCTSNGRFQINDSLLISKTTLPG